jgi:hypothetical protein
MMEIKDLIECIERATVKMEVMVHVDLEGAHPEWLELVEPRKLIEELQSLMAKAVENGKGE